MLHGRDFYKKGSRGKMGRAIKEKGKNHRTQRLKYAEIHLLIHLLWEKSSNQVAYIDGCSWEKSSNFDMASKISGKYQKKCLNGGVVVRWERYRLHHGKILFLPCFT